MLGQVFGTTAGTSVGTCQRGLGLLQFCTQFLVHVYPGRRQVRVQVLGETLEEMAPAFNLPQPWLIVFADRELADARHCLSACMPSR